MIVDIIIILLVVVLPIFVGFFVRAETRAIADRPTTAPAPAPAPAPKDSRPLWAQAPMPDYVPPRCTAWENEQARIDARLLREAEAAKAAREEAEADRRLRARLEREKQERLAFDREWQAANNRHKPEKKPWYTLTHLEVRYPKD